MVIVAFYKEMVMKDKVLPYGRIYGSNTIQLI